MTVIYLSRNKSVLPYNLSCIKRLMFMMLVLLSIASYGESLESSYTLHADNVEYNNKKNILIATGNVELFSKDYLLTASKILYDKNNNKAFAYGKVVLIKPDGEELYADSLELDNNLTEILAYKLKARFEDGNIFTARYAHSYPDRIIFDKATYSPCKVCKTHEPQWQIRSSKIKYFKKKNTIYVNNFFDVYGITSFYLPYLRVASHDATPRSGFLFPNYYSYKRIYGHGISIPYYLRISDSNDFLYSPTITTKKRILHFGKYRFMLQKQHTNTIAFDYVKDKQKPKVSAPKNRFYVKSNFNHMFDSKLLLNGDIETVSDKSYLRNYRGQNKNYLKSVLNLNYSTDSSQFNGSGHHFQELRTADTNYNTDITVAPRLRYDKTFINENSRYYFRSDALNIIKKKGGNTSKANLKLDWVNSHVFHNHKIETSKIVYLDLYKFSNITTDTPILHKKKYTYSRVVPELAVTWKYPFLLSNNINLTYIEPLVKFIASPANVHNDKIFNEDSQEIELSDSNLFNNNRYSGSDRLEEGLRVNYGITGSGQALSNIYPKYNFVFGQSYRFKKGGDYSFNSGLRDKRLSDYVGRLSFKTSYITDFHYLFQIDQKNHSFRRNELNSVFNFDLDHKNLQKLVIDTKLSAYNYKNNPKDRNDLNNIKKSVSLDGTLYFFKEWYLSAGFIENFDNKRSIPIETKFALGYNGQCTKITLSAINNSTSDIKRGIMKSGFTYNFEILLKNINY